MTRVLFLATALVALVGTGVRGQLQDPVLIVVQRAAAYVADYQQKLSMVVAQERYEQEVRYPGNARSRDLIQRTVLVSDFLLVRSPQNTWVPFRDVFERDNRPVRDREERLSRLFLNDAGTAFDQAGRIAEESSRYNIGNINRNINVPTLPLEFVGDGHRARFSFAYEGGFVNGVRVVRFQEERGPTYIRTTNGRDLPTSGKYWIHAETGRVERTELRASDDVLDAQIIVMYRPDEASGLWVPERMQEKYSHKRDRSEIRGTATYSRYRRFQITTSDELTK